MKKIVNWVLAIAFIILVIDWVIIGMKLLNGIFDFVIEAYMGVACFVIIFGCILYRAFSDKCPHRGKARLTRGSYCSYCGKKID